MNQFVSRFDSVGEVALPQFSGTRIMMMPVVIGDASSLPLTEWHDAFVRLSRMAPEHLGATGYLTIDEKRVARGETHRRAGVHVDGVFRGSCGAWGGGGGGAWGGLGNGMLTVASHVGCRAWNQSFEGLAGYEGECDHLADQFGIATVFEANRVYWLDGLCVHESMPMLADTDRQFVRLSLPSSAPWFEGYTANPFGVVPTGEILPQREFMNS